MKTYVISRGNQYWNHRNSCWTEARQAASEYSSVDDLPAELPADNLQDDETSNLELWHEGDITDARYYDPDNDIETVAATVPYGETEE